MASIMCLIPVIGYASTYYVISTGTKDSRQWKLDFETTYIAADTYLYTSKGIVTGKYAFNNITNKTCVYINGSQNVLKTFKKQDAYEYNFTQTVSKSDQTGHFTTSVQIDDPTYGTINKSYYR